MFTIKEDSDAIQRPKYHPLFSLDDADIVLASRDGMTSSWFRAMFTLPTRNPSRANDGTVVHHTRAASYAYVCRLAITYVCSGVPLWLDRRRVYSLDGSLTLNLHDSVHRPALLRLRTTDLYLLFELHHNRRAQFRARLGESPFLTDAQLSDAAAPRCSRCREPVSYAEWRELKHAMLYELERRPAGDTVLTGLEVWGTAQACWSAKCKNVRCQSPVYDKTLSSKAIKDMLPSDSEPAA
ncbi:hypothetical protein BGW80DRAFT_1283145 [Lactifluus volemus]|nr:hypothetical protein BGW80DRAFT_1283145 [Lactifluus volemus]